MDAGPFATTVCILFMLLLLGGPPLLIAWIYSRPQYRPTYHDLRTCKSCGGEVCRRCKQRPIAGLSTLSGSWGSISGLCQLCVRQATREELRQIVKEDREG